MQSGQRKIKVLHVDDEPDFLIVTKYNLEKKYADFSVDTATTAEKGLTLLKSGNYDVVVSDYQMPGMDGLEFLQNLRASGDKIPFIMFTGRGREEVAIEALNKGANHYLQKGGDMTSLYQTLAHVITELVERKRAEEKVVEIEKEHQIILDALPLNIFHINCNSEFVHVNKVLAERYGLKPEEFKGKTSRDLFPDVGATYIKSDQAVFESGKRQIGTIRRIVTPQGEKWVRLDKVPLKDADGNVTGIIGFELDITEQAQTQETLRESEKKLSQIVLGSPIPTFVIDHGHVVTHWNTACEQLTGFSAAEMVGTKKQWLAFYPEERPVMADFVVDEQSEEMITSFYADKYQKSDLIEGAYEASDFFPSLGDGGKWLFFTAAPLRDSKGRIIGALETLQDVTGLKSAEEALRVNEEKYRTLTETVTDIIFTTNNEGGFTYLSTSCERITGYRTADLIGHSITEILAPEYVESTLERFKRGFTGETLPLYEVEIKHRNGTRIPIELNVTTLRDANGQILGRLGVARDITERKHAEEALRESERKHQIILDSVPVGIFHIDADSRFVHVNKALAERYGMKPEDFKGKTSRDLFPEAAEDYIKSDIEVLESGEPHIGSIRRINTPQGVRWVRLDKVPLKDDDGNVTGIIGFELDVTERKRIEDALQESELEHQTVLDTVPVGIYHIDADSRFVHVNKALAERYGMKPADFKGKTSRELFPDVGEEYIESDKEVVESGVPQSGVARKLTTSEGVKWVRLDKVPLTDADGNITDIVGFELDITERIKAQEELRDAHKQLQDIIEFLPDPTLVIDRDMKVIAWNRAIEEMTGIQKDDIIGKGDYEYALPFYGERRPILTDLVFSSNEEIESRYTQVGKKGNTLFAEVYSPFMYQGKGAYLWGIATPLFDRKGDIVGAIESIRDITDRKQAEKERDGLLKELEAKNREMEHFAYTVSHDLRSPLITIQGFTTMLRKDLEQDEREKAESDLKYIENAVTKMGTLLSDTLELSRIGRFVNPPEDVPFEEIVSGALEQTAGELKAMQIDVSVAEGFPTVHVDRMRIVEVLVNLITNSIKYRGDQPHPKIEIGDRVDGKDTVFFVKDNGIGIEKSQQEKVFELFYQVDKSEAGTGAGLAIVKRIIEVHEGRIWIESEKDKGCTVCFTLPVSP